MKYIAIALLFFSLSAHAIDKKELLWDAGQLAASGADAYITDWGRQQPNFRELNPVARPFMGSRAGLVVFFGAGAAGNIILGHYLHRHGHGKLEIMQRSAGIIGNASAAAFDSRNYR